MKLKDLFPVLKALGSLTSAVRDARTAAADPETPSVAPLKDPVAAGTAEATATASAMAVATAIVGAVSYCAPDTLTTTTAQVAVGAGAAVLAGVLKVARKAVENRKAAGPQGQ